MKNSDSNLASIDVHFLPDDEKFEKLYQNIRNNISEVGWDENSYLDYNDKEILDLLKSFVSQSIDAAIKIYQQATCKSIDQHIE